MSNYVARYDDENEEGEEGEESSEARYVKWLAALDPKKKKGGETTVHRSVNIGTRTTIVNTRHYSVFGGRTER